MDKNIWVIAQSDSHILTNIITDNFIMLGLAERINIRDKIDNVTDLNIVLNEISACEDAIVYYIFDEDDLYDETSRFCGSNNITCYNIHRLAFTFFYKTISKGLYGNNASEGVEKKIDQAAIDFAIQTDDGKDIKAVEAADIVIIGISRTTKTPLSMYLSNHGFKVANIPLVPEIKLPEILLEIPSNKVIALTMDPDRLVDIRKERLKYLGLPENSVYATLGRVKDEMKYAKEVVEKIGCRTVDVSSMSIEETADVIKNTMERKI